MLLHLASTLFRIVLALCLVSFPSALFAGEERTVDCGAGTANAGKRWRVIIVDEVKDLRDSVADLMRARGYHSGEILLAERLSEVRDLLTAEGDTILVIGSRAPTSAFLELTGALVGQHPQLVVIAHATLELGDAELPERSHWCLKGSLELFDVLHRYVQFPRT